MVEEPSLEERRFELDKYRVEQEVKLNADKLALELQRARRERLMWYNPGLLSFAISLAAAIVSAGQVWVAYVSKEKEIVLADKQNQRENDRRAEETRQQMSLERAKFIAANPTIFAGINTDATRQRMLLNTLYPPDIAEVLAPDSSAPLTSLSDSGAVKAEAVSSAIRLTKESGDGQLIPLREWRNFGVKVVNEQGAPVRGAKVAWEQKEAGAVTYVGATDANGVTTATNMHSSSMAGSFAESASLVGSETPIGFTDSRQVRRLGPTVRFTFRQQ